MAISASLTISVSGCGTQVPSITEFWGNRDSSEKAVQAVAEQIHCELKRAVQDVINPDKTKAGPIVAPAVTALISKWLVQVNLNLTVEEKTEFNPGVTLTSPLAPITSHFTTGNFTTNPTFSLGIGAATSADTIRLQKLTFVYTVEQLARSDYGTNPDIGVCVQQMPAGYLMTQSDLKIGEALRSGLGSYQLQGTGDAIPPQAIVHQVTFKIATNAGVTPTWKLLRVTASNNSGTSLLGATRNRTQDVIFTFGPAAQQPGPQPVLATVAQNAAFAAELGSAIRSLQALQ